MPEAVADVAALQREIVGTELLPTDDDHAPVLDRVAARRRKFDRVLTFVYCRSLRPVADALGAVGGLRVRLLRLQDRDDLPFRETEAPNSRTPGARSASGSPADQACLPNCSAMRQRADKTA
jgi:hypothetical protein